MPQENHELTDLALQSQLLAEANSPLESFSFAWISDSHFVPHPSVNEYGVDAHTRTLDVLEQVAEFNREHTPLSAIVHTGDVTDRVAYNDSAAYALYDREMQTLNLPPAYYALGNHDNPDSFQDLLQFGDRCEEFQDMNRVCYSFEIQGVPAFVLDARVDTGAKGRIDEDQIAWLEERLAEIEGEKKALVFLHFPLFEQKNGWVKEKMLVENGDIVHQRLVPYAEKILAVMHGHVHASRQTVRDGIFYASAPSTSYAFDVDTSGEQWVPAEMVDHDGLTGFSIVDISLSDDESRVSVRQRLPHRGDERGD
jgi:alkaline phosphatase